jgi:antimicrobial peptide system SdpA family protein
MQSRQEDQNARPSPREARELRCLGGLLVSMLAVWATLGAYGVHASLRFNPITLPYEHKATLMELLPEGWRFFTRNPQEEQVQPFVRRDGAWISASTQPNSRARNLFGLDRSGRAQSVELALILEALPREAWVDCTGAPSECLGPVPVALVFANPVAERSICGDVALIAQRPVPWAWAASPDIDMPSRVARLEVTC